MGVGATPGLIPMAHSHRQMQPDEEDGDFDVVFQLQLKEMLQQLLTMLRTATLLSPQPAVWPRRESQPHGPRKER